MRFVRRKIGRAPFSSLVTNVCSRLSFFFVAAAKVRGWGAEAKPLESYARGRGGAPRLGASLKGYELKKGKGDPPTRPRYNVYKSFGIACVYWGFGLFLVGASVGWSVSVGCVEAVRWVSACGKIRAAFGGWLN